jgi:hypothetical protein
MVKQYTYYSTYSPSFVPSLYQCFETRNIQVFWLLSQQLSYLRFNLFVISETFLDPFTRQTLPTVNRKLFFMNILCIECFCPQNAQKTLLLVSTLLKHGRHFDYWNQPLNMRMRACCLDCHEAGLCCYIVITIEDLLRPLQLFYFHLWPIYWLSHVVLSYLKPWREVQSDLPHTHKQSGLCSIHMWGGPQNNLFSLRIIQVRPQLSKEYLKWFLALFCNYWLHINFIHL